MKDKNLMRKFSTRKVATFIMFTLLLVLVVLALMYFEPDTTLKNYLDNQVSPTLFLILMLLLPFLGFPLSPFLILVGMKFGIAIGITITALVMALHMIFTYYLVQLFLRDWTILLLKKIGIPLPEEKMRLNNWQALLFMIIPGLPYAVKNCLLALSSISFGAYLLINWCTQFSLSIPFIIIGKAAIDVDPTVISVGLIFLLLIFLLQYMARKKFKKILNTQEPFRDYSIESRDDDQRSV